jgi:hypothetical protein
VEKLIKFQYKETDSIALQVFELLKLGQKAVLIANFPENGDKLIEFVNKIGIPILEERNLNNGEIFEVKVIETNGIYNSYANSNFEFPCHTDCSDFSIIPNCLGLFCVNPSKIGGETLICSLDDIIPKLNSDLLNWLLNHIFTFRNIESSILKYPKNEYSVQYNRITIESFSNQLSNTEQKYLDEFDFIIRDNTFTIKLNANDLLFCRNDKFLHGRSAFDANSQRNVKRIRFNLIEMKQTADI